VRTGIFGGTFDPIHIAHLHAGEMARHRVGLDRVLFMPAGDPWQKAGRDLTPSPHRLEMVRLAVSDVDGLEPDDRETKREGPSYTIDTLATFPDDEELFLLLGADAAAGFRTWHRWHDIVARAGILIVPRPGSDLGIAREAVSGGRVVDMTALDISATDIRRRVAAGEPYRFLVPPLVYEYIEANGPYEEPSAGDRVGPANEQEDSS
jgi:nicotinate-nucleotide adenylyltransferase